MLLIGDADRLTDPVTGRLEGWADAFSNWDGFAILTPKPVSSWGARERTLAGRFMVLPATTEALFSLVDIFSDSCPTETRSGAIHEEVDSVTPPSEQVKRLQLALDPRLFSWLCATAVYPEVHWDLTLYLASLPCMPENLVTEANLLRLIDLPWFRTGAIPDEIRFELIRHLNSEQDRQTRQAIVELIEQNPAAADTFAFETQALEIAVNRDLLSRSKKRRAATHELVRKVLTSDSVGNHVAVRLIESVQTSPLDFLLPRRLRYVFYERGLSAFGMRTATRFALTVAVVVIGLGAISSWTPSHRPTPAKPLVVLEYGVAIESNVPGAKYRVDGNPPASRYRAGTEHIVTAEMPGYKPVAKPFTLPSEPPKSPYVISLQLEPELARLELTSDLRSGKVSLDGGPPEDLKDGNFGKDGIALSTDHTFSLTAGTGSLEFSFRAEPGKIVTLAAPPKARDIKAWVIANLASRAHAYAGDTSLKAGPKDHPETIPVEGLELGTITADTEITVDDGRSPQTYSLKAGNAPTLTIFLGSDSNSASIHIEGVPPGADVLVAVDRRTPIRPHNNYLGLLAGQHTLVIIAAGYYPAEQKVDLQKGERRDLQVELKPVVQTATLMIEGATPQTEVLLDGSSKGTLDGNGSFKLAYVPPGDHTVALRKADFEPKEIPKTFTAGQTVHISGADGQLKPIPLGTLAFRVSPSSAIVTYRQVDESQMRKTENRASRFWANGQELPLKAGRYEVAATAAGYQSRQETVTIESGKTQTIGWTLAPVPVTSSRGTVVTPPSEKKTPDYFQDPASWTLSDAWWIHKGSNTSWLIRGQGAYRIEFLRKTSKVLFVTKTRHVDWVIDDKGPDNHVEYSFDFRTLVRRVTVNGSTTESKPVQLPPAAASAEGYAIQIEIGSDRIVIKDAQGKELDQYQRPNPAEPLGKFGFKGEVGLVVK